MPEFTRFWPFIATKKKPTVRPETLGYMALATYVIAGSTATAFSKQMTGIFAPYTLLFISELLAGVFTALSFGIVPLVKQVMKFDLKTALTIIVVASCSSIIAPLLYFTGLVQTSAANAELFLRSQIVIIVLLAAIFLKEKLKPAQIGAACILIFGVAIVGARGFQEFSLQAGDLYILGAALSFSCGSILFKKRLSHLHPETVIICRSTLAVSSFLVIFPFLEHNLAGDLDSFPVSGIMLLLGYGFLTRFLPLFSFYEAVERLPVGKVSMFGTLSIVGSVTFIGLYLGEPIYWYHIVGCALIVLGAFLMQLAGGIHKVKKKSWLDHLKFHHRNHF